MLQMKICMVGDEDSQRFEFGNLILEYPKVDFMTTIGTRFHVWDHMANNRQYKFSIWEIANQNPKNTDDVYTNSFMGIIFVNTNSQRSIHAAIEFLISIWHQNGRGAIPILFCDTSANPESELPDREALVSMIEKLSTFTFVQIIHINPESAESATLIRAKLPTLIDPWLEQQRRNRLIHCELEQIIYNLIQRNFPSLKLGYSVLSEGLVSG